MAIYCTSCGREIAEGVAFCTECGMPVPEAVTQPRPEAPAEAAVCKKCGTVLSEDVGFCTECGTPRNVEFDAQAPKAETPAPEATKAEAPQAPIPPKQTYIPPAQSYAPPEQSNTPPMQTAAALDPASKVVSTGAFFGLQFLFGIPVIGWLVCLIMAFAPKNKNIKHYARATLIWLIIGLVAAVGLYFMFRWVGGVIMDFINQATDGTFGEWGGFFEQFKEIGDITKQIPGGGFENLPIE